MKRKKWSELEEQTLLTKYSDLLNSGTLSKLKTREKKFRPIADYVNTMHHLQDPITFPFKWSWRDVSIKVQNMRHQYLGVKQKIRVSKDEFNWTDGENHWENFLKYKEVFGDIELEVRGSSKKLSGGGGGGGSDNGDLFGDCCDLGLSIDCEEDGHDGDSDDGEGESESGGEKEIGEMGVAREWKSKKGFGLLAAQVIDLRNVVVGTEEKRKEREFLREKDGMEIMEKRRKMEFRKGRRRDEREEEVEGREGELEERELAWARREMERGRLERELDEERRRRRRMMEEKRDEEEMEWRERMTGLQIEHEKTMMQMHADACQNQMQILGVMARFVCQFFGAGNDGLGGGLGGLPPQVLQNLQHPGGLGDNGKPDSNSPSEFM